jgi:cytochrome c-type biogenesis protein CcsB
MNKLTNALFSMRAMALGMLVFLVAIARATFIESTYGVQSAKVIIYNALWFEILLAFLSINLIANIIRYKMWVKEKITVFLFHISFLVIIIGAFVTRNYGFEGRMSIREGEASNFIYTSEPYLWIIIDNKYQYYSDPIYQSTYNPFYRKMIGSDVNHFTMDFKIPNHATPVHIEHVKFQSKHKDSLMIHPKYKSTALDIVTDGMKSNYVVTGEKAVIAGVEIAFSNDKSSGINVIQRNGNLFMRPAMDMQFIPMKEMQKARQTGAAIPDSSYVRVKAGEEVPFATTTLYQIAGSQFVFKQAIKNAGKELVPTGKKDQGLDYLTIRMTDANQSKLIRLAGGMNEVPVSTIVDFNGVSYDLRYGMRNREIPFSVKCDDFMLDRYPGSDVPSSYASDLRIIDPKNGVSKKQRVFMNHVIDHDGYRFFQSAYDPDEKGTILSVNHDEWGTNITYLGYLLMTIGMILTLFAKNSRFTGLLSKLKKSSALGLTLIALSLSNVISAQTTTHDHSAHQHDHQQEKQVITPPKQAPIFISEEQADEIARLLVQDFDGRIIPMHTLCDNLLRKIYRKNKFEGYNAIQTIMSIHLSPDAWVDKKVIQVPKAVREKLQLSDYASFRDLTLDNGQFKWINEYNAALQKPESGQNEFQKKLIKLVEKQQVFLGMLQWYYMKIVPLKNDPKQLWYNPFSPDLLKADTVSARLSVMYVGSLLEKNSKSSDLLQKLKQVQRKLARPDILPSESHVTVEISYNKMGIFKNTEYTYLLIGFILMVLFFIKTLANPSEKGIKRFAIFRKILVAVLVVFFLYHGAGLGMRWYISGHAPWSNGYEAVIFIAWSTMIAGFLFSRSNPAILAGTTILAAFMIFVTELNLLDPEITPLQPVLKSYWLMIHVAVITSSYGFLGLAFILGIFNLFLFIARNEKNNTNLMRNINELTYVSELTMTIGLFMLTIGTFLGGIWANESWGRYWGWDPKETWALVSVLVYAIILHLRFIPGLKGKFAFNVASVWGYGAIIFTFLGVNFILVGLHSYAQGDGAVSFPWYVWVTVLAFLLLTIIAGMKNARMNKLIREEF